MVETAYQGGYTPQMSDSNLISNKIQLSDKMIEPEKNIVENRINRNQVLGNIKSEQLVLLQNQWRISTLLREIPAEEGGFVFGRIAGVLENELNFLFVASNSVEGFGRLSTATNVMKSEYKDNTPTSNLAGFFTRGKKE